MFNPNLAPCPFCGGVAQFVQTSYGTDSGACSMDFQIRCERCDASAPNGSGKIRVGLNYDGTIRVITDEREKAVEAWNRRANNAD